MYILRAHIERGKIVTKVCYEGHSAVFLFYFFDIPPPVDLPVAFWRKALQTVSHLDINGIMTELKKLTQLYYHRDI